MSNLYCLVIGDPPGVSLHHMEASSKGEAIYKLLSNNEEEAYNFLLGVGWVNVSDLERGKACDLL